MSWGRGLRLAAKAVRAPGALYAAALERELRAKGHIVAREYAVQVMYKGEPIGFQRLDMVVDATVVVEIKSTPVVHPMFKRQLISYLRATNLSTGLLLHFGPSPKAHRLYGRISDLDQASRLHESRIPNKKRRTRRSNQSVDLPFRSFPVCYRDSIEPRPVRA